MTNEEFRSYLDRGLGRAVLLLQKEADPGAFAGTLYEWLIAVGSENGFSAVYKKELIDCLPQPESFVRRLSRDAVKSVKNGKLVGVEDVLRLYGQSGELCRALEEVYARCYGELREYTERGVPSDEYPPCVWLFHETLLSLARLTVDEARIEQMLLDMADLYAINGEILPTTPTVPRLEGCIGWKKVRELLERIRSRHPCGNHLWEQSVFSERVAAPDWLTPPLTLEMIQRYTEEQWERMVHHLWTLRKYMQKAPPELLCEIARRGMEETDPRRRWKLLMLFVGENTRIDPPPFPLSPAWLIDQVETVLVHPASQPEKWECDAAQVCLRLLCRVRHPAVREYAETLLQTFFVPEAEDPRANLPLQMRGGVPDSMIRRCALRMRWCANYEETDRAALSEILRTPGSFDWDVCAALAIRAFSLGEMELSPEWIPSLYESRIHTDREELVNALLSRGQLPDALREESKYDSNLAIRKMVQGDAP